MTVNIFPPGLETGRVYNSILKAYGNTPPQGTVTFTPDHHTQNIVPDDDGGTTVLYERVVCRIHQGTNETNDPDFPPPTDEADRPAWEQLMQERAGDLIDPEGNVGAVELPVGVWTAYYNLEDTRAVADSVYFILTEADTQIEPFDLAKVVGIKPLPNGDLAWHGSVPPPQDMLWLYVDPQYDPDSGQPLPTYTAPNGTITHGELIEWEA